MRLLTDSVEADEGYVSTQQQQQQHQQHQQQHQIRKTNTKQNLQRRQPKNMNSIHSTDTLSSDESSMSSSPSPADYVFDIMCHDQHNSLSMLDIKDPFYEPFFGMDISNNNTSTNNESMVGGMSSSFSLQNLANATTTDVLQQLFPNEENNAMADIPMPDYIHKQKKPQKSVTKKYNKKQKHIKNSSSMMNLIKNTTMLPTANHTWIDPSVYPLWPNYICLYLEYSLPYDPSVS